MEQLKLTKEDYQSYLNQELNALKITMMSIEQIYQTIAWLEAKINSFPKIEEKKKKGMFKR